VIERYGVGPIVTCRIEGRNERAQRLEFFASNLGENVFRFHDGGLSAQYVGVRRVSFQARFPSMTRSFKGQADQKQLTVEFANRQALRLFLVDFERNAFVSIAGGGREIGRFDVSPETRDVFAMFRYCAAEL